MNEAKRILFELPTAEEARRLAAKLGCTVKPEPPKPVIGRNVKRFPAGLPTRPLRKPDFGATKLPAVVGPPPWMKRKYETQKATQ